MGCELNEAGEKRGGREGESHSCLGCLRVGVSWRHKFPLCCALPCFCRAVLCFAILLLRFAMLFPRLVHWQIVDPDWPPPSWEGAGHKTISTTYFLCLSLCLLLACPLSLSLSLSVSVSLSLSLSRICSCDFCAVHAADSPRVLRLWPRRQHPYLSRTPSDAGCSQHILLAAGLLRLLPSDTQPSRGGAPTVLVSLSWVFGR